MLLLFASPLIVGALVILSAAHSRLRNGPLSRALTIDPPLFFICFVGSVVVSVLLSLTSLWPFSFASPLSNSREIASIIVHHRQVGAGLLWLAVATMVVPLLEEILYRFGLLNLLEHFTGSAKVAVVGSSILFGLAHLSFVDPLGRRTAVFATLMGLISALLARKSGGNLTCSIAIHCGRNSIELFLLFSIAFVGS